MAALEQLNSELGIPMPELIRTVEQALADAYRHAFDPPGYVTVHIDPDTAAMTVTRLWSVKPMPVRGSTI